MINSDYVDDAFERGSNCAWIIDRDWFYPLVPKKLKNYAALYIDAYDIIGVPLQLLNTVHAISSSILNVIFVTFFN